ncbi:MFS transporter [Streptomyces sp. NPDC058045]|uniref:MFS transporter n=1 Tax=Streptomyces sp. NPDC058045 TaxID=3346311 RepID=UPI0036E4D710
MTPPPTATTAKAPAPERPAHRDGTVLRWLAAYSCSTLGDNIYYVALSWTAVQAGTPTQAGLVTAASALPRALLMLGGGVVADRLGLRRVVLGSDAVRCAAVFAVAGLLLATGPALWLLAALALLFGVVDAFFLPAVGALPSRIAAPGQLARVHGMRGIAVRLANILGAPLAGLGVALGGPATAFAAAGLLFAASVPLLATLRIKDGTSGARGSVRERPTLRDGLRYVAGHRVLAPLVLVSALGDLGFIGPLNIGLALLADERGWGTAGIGWVLAGFGTGSGAASLLLAVRGRVPRAGLVLSVTSVAGAGAIALIALMPRASLAGAAALALGLLMGLSGALCGALTQTQADPARIGRVTALTSLFSMGVAPLTFPLTGAAIGAWGTVPVFTTGAALCAAGGLVGLASPTLRRAELPA